MGKVLRSRPSLRVRRRCRRHLRQRPRARGKERGKERARARARATVQRKVVIPSTRTRTRTRLVIPPAATKPLPLLLLRRAFRHRPGPKVARARAGARVAVDPTGAPFVRAGNPLAFLPPLLPRQRRRRQVTQRTREKRTPVRSERVKARAKGKGKVMGKTTSLIPTTPTLRLLPSRSRQGRACRQAEPGGGACPFRQG